MLDQIFKNAFLVKKARFFHLNPELSDEELTKITVKYFKELLRDEVSGKGTFNLIHQDSGA